MDKAHRRASHAALAVVLLSAPLLAVTGAGAAQRTADKDHAAALVAEVKKSFTVGGQPIPPEIFRDMGDGDMADSGTIWVTVDAAAAIGSNLYYDPIERENGWVSQKAPAGRPFAGEESGYHYVGSTANGLLVVIASWSGGGSGEFFTLHILDVAAMRAFDDSGQIKERIDLTIVRNIALGDRWDGDVKIAKNTITITKLGPGVGVDSRGRPTVTIKAVRP